MLESHTFTCHKRRDHTVGAWEDKDSLSLIMINNCLENTIVSHVQFYTPAHLAWQELINLFESHDDVTKIYTKDKVHTLKMKENESVAKHIQNVRAHLEQLFIVGSTIPNHLYTYNTLVEVALIMMKYCSIH